MKHQMFRCVAPISVLTLIFLLSATASATPKPRECDAILIAAGKRKIVSRAMAPNGLTSVVAMENGSFMIVDIANDHVLTEGAGSGKAFRKIKVAPDGKSFIALAGRSTFEIRDMVQGKLEKTIQASGYVDNFDLSPDGLYLAYISGKRFSVVDVPSAQILGGLDRVKLPKSKKFKSDFSSVIQFVGGRRFLFFIRQNKKKYAAQVYDTMTGTEFGNLQSGVPITAYDIPRSGDRIVLGYADGGVKVWALMGIVLKLYPEARSLVSRLSQTLPDGAVVELGYSGSGQVIDVVTEGGGIFRWAPDGSF